MLDSGFTLIELIIVLMIISILLLLSIPSLQGIRDYHSAYVDMARLNRAIHFARGQAIYRQQRTKLSPINSDWQHGYIITINGKTIAHFQAISQGAHLRWQNFPNYPYLQFTEEGFTAYQNGTFTYQTKDHKITRKLIINQTGRTRIE